MQSSIDIPASNSTTYNPTNEKSEVSSIASSDGKKNDMSNGGNEVGNETSQSTTGNASGEGAGRDEQKKSSDNGKSATSAPDRPIPPVLKGTLSYNEVSRRHILRGMWNFESGSQFAAQRFELNRSLDPKEDPTILPKDGVFHGTFSLAYFHINAKGKRKEKSKVIHEKDVHIYFKKKEGKNEEFDVNGEGTNQFGVFQINGTAIRDDYEKEPQYKVELRKKYVTPPLVPGNPPSSKKKKSSKGRKRKFPNISDKGEDISEPPIDDGPLPPPSQSFASNVYCLRGKYAQISGDSDEVEHKISGLWSSGLDLIEADPDNAHGLCNLFEYEQRYASKSMIFPLSGRYTGWFNISKEDGTITRINERDVTLKFRKNNAGYYNVEGKGSNAFGKYDISGTLDKSNILTIFRHFQSKRRIPATQSTISAVNGSASLHQGGNENDPPQMTLDDVVVEEQDSYDPINLPADGEYSALSRGTFRINPNEESHTCSGKWAISKNHINIPSMQHNFNFGLEAHHIPPAIKEMKQKGIIKMDEDVVFPVDSIHYKGSFKMKRGTTKLQSVIDKQMVLKFRKNLKGYYNIYGKGVNEIGTFKLVGTLVLNSPTGGMLELYRTYEPEGSLGSSLPSHVPIASHRSGKALLNAPRADFSSQSSSLNTSTPQASASVSGSRRESSRQTKLPSRLEDNDPEAQKIRMLEKCLSILKLISQTDESSGRFFLEPVDPVAHGIPTYHEIITNPMDLGTIQNKMDSNEIDSPEEFAGLVRLVFHNALKFNVDPSHAVHQAARDLLALFNKKYRDVERMAERKKPSKTDLKEAKRSKLTGKGKKRSECNSASLPEEKRIEVLESSLQEVATALGALASSITNEHVPFLNVLQLMHNHISLIQGTMLTTLKPSSAFSVPTTTVVQPTKKVKPKPKPKPKSVKSEPIVVESKLPLAPVPSVTIPKEEKPLTLAEQQDLTEAINAMPEENLLAIIEIIKESADFDIDQGEIDVDIDKIDTATQRKLQNFVNKNKPKPRGKTTKPKPAHASPMKVEDSPKNGASVDTPPKPSVKKDGCFDTEDSDSEVSAEDEPGSGDGMPDWNAESSDESGLDESGSEVEDENWDAAHEELKNRQAREKEKKDRDAEEEAKRIKNEERNRADLTAKRKKIEEESMRRKEEEERARDEKEKKDRDRRDAIRQGILDSFDTKQTVRIDDKEDMEGWEHGGDSPASSNFGF